MFTCAAVASDPPNWKVSTSDCSRSLSRATWPSRDISKALCGSCVVQKSPLGRMPGVRSWTCDPEPGSQVHSEEPEGAPLAGSVIRDVLPLHDSYVELDVVGLALAALGWPGEDGEQCEALE